MHFAGSRGKPQALAIITLQINISLRVVCHRSISVIQRIESSDLINLRDTELKTVQLVSLHDRTSQCL